MRVCVLGAGGIVGRTLLKVLEERNFPVDDIILFGTEEKELILEGKVFKIEKFRGKVPDCDIFFSCLEDEEAKEVVPEIVKRGKRVIDNSSAFRLEEGVPLVVPEVNKDHLKKSDLLIANPNCSTIQLVLSISPFLRFGIKKIFVSTYQSVSGAGKKGLYAYQKEKRGEILTNSPFPFKIFENLFPYVGEIKDGESKEERKIFLESRKILKNDNLEIYATCVRVPVPYVHSQSVFVEFEKEVSLDELKDEIEKRSYLVYDEIPVPNRYIDKDVVGVGRIRVRKNVLSFFSCMDNLRKGAATNAVQIGEFYV
ncbi:MAG: aspartate-semialdehyde dehydrogenase [Candidatus Hydrothermales bacterium]